jgi:small subunit ribosomal protein S20
MANSKQAIKRARQAVNRRARNMSLRSNYRTALKKARNATEPGAVVAEAGEVVRASVSTLDKIASKGIIHRNKANRLKSQLARRMKALSGTVAQA